MYRSFTISILLALFLTLMTPVILLAQGPRQADQTSPDDDWRIYLYASPASDGTGLWAFTGKVANICQNGTVQFIADRGAPAPFSGKYEPDTESYAGFLDDFFLAGTDNQTGTLEVRCILPDDVILKTAPIIFKRYYYPNDSSPAPVPVVSPDNEATLSLFTTSLNAPHYIIVMTTNALPAPLPSGVEPVGSPYSFRSYNTIFASDGPMRLELGFFDTSLNNANPLALRIFEWDASTATWLADDDYALAAFPSISLNKAAARFTTYTLANTPHWLDSFTTDMGLETRHNVKPIFSGGGRLKLDDTTLLTGTVISKPYTPTLTNFNWHGVSYTGDTPTGTTLQVSVLSQAGEVLAELETPGDTNLAGIDAHRYPSLKLRAVLSTTSDESPELFDWSLWAEPKSYAVYLPALIKD